MEMAILILAGIAVLLLILGAVALYVKPKKKRPADFYSLFIIGLIFFVVGFPLGNIGLWGLGAIFVVIGAMNRRSWKKNQSSWEDFGEKEKKACLLLLVLASILVAATALVLMLT